MPSPPLWYECYNETTVEEDYVNKENELHIAQGLLILEVNELANTL